MNRSTLLARAGACGLGIATLLALGACAGSPSGAPAAAAPDMSWVPQARQVATAVPPKLLAVLQEEITRGSHEGAVSACRDKAPAMARTASEQTGWQIRRVSLRNRNPQAVPDAWERAVLEGFDRQAAAKVPAAQLERSDVVMENGRAVQRYMRALPTLELCTHCHGPADRLSPAVSARLAQLYPKDLATGYQVGDIRGAITLRRPAP